MEPTLPPILTDLHHYLIPRLSIESPRRRAIACRGPSTSSEDSKSPRSQSTTCDDNNIITTPLSHSTSFCRDRAETYGLLSAGVMARNDSLEEKETLLSNGESSVNPSHDSRDSIETTTSASTTSLVLENLNANGHYVGKPKESFEYRDDDSDPEILPYEERRFMGAGKSMTKNLKRIIWIISLLALAGWGLALVSFLFSGRYKHGSTLPYDHDSPVKSAGRKITFESVQNGLWRPNKVDLDWIDGANDEDGLLLESNQPGQDFLVVQDVRARKGDPQAYAKQTLLKSEFLVVDGEPVSVNNYWPSPDLKKVLVLSARQKVYRHSFTGLYYVVDVATQKAQPLDLAEPKGRVQLAQWSPTSDAVVFTRDNNLFVRSMDSSAARQITKDGGPEFFYGIPDWVYEEEVLQNNIATWWARDGKYVAFMRTNETMVPEFPIDYFLSRPSNNRVEEGLEAYPDEVRIKYPKPGAPNPVVDMLFYDVGADETFEVKIEGGFADNDRLIGDVTWADNGKVLVRELNRESDKVRLVLVDVVDRSGKVVRTIDLKALDGGWEEPAHPAKYIPADPANGRPKDGYLDTIVYDNNDHLAYFTPLDSADPIMLTKGNWEIEQDSIAVDLKNNLVYFTSTKVHSTQRHLYSVHLNGKEMKAIVPVDRPAYYTASFSAKAGYAIIAYEGPGIPTQKVISMPTNPNKYEETLEENKSLEKMASQHEMPHLVYSNVTIDGFTLNVVERRPPHFDPSKKYPVLFQLYGGPVSQQVSRQFRVDFQSYIASSLGYVVVTVDGRGTGYIGRKARTIIRGNLGYYEAIDQIETAKIWSKKKYVDAERLAIWGWSYGGFMTLKVLETDAGQTFKYGMAVAPVTDWRFYDSIYTERYMMTPQHNPSGYDKSAITNVSALSQNVRWLMMHGASDDNVHTQNSLVLIDKLDLADVTNYDMQFFPDSDHSIYFHGANNVVYGKLSDWLVNAFNGVWYRVKDPVPKEFEPS